MAKPITEADSPNATTTADSGRPYTLPPVGSNPGNYATATTPGQRRDPDP